MAGGRRSAEMAQQQHQAFPSADHYPTPHGVDLPGWGPSSEDLRGGELLRHLTGKGFKLGRESLPPWDEGPFPLVEDFRGWDG